MTTTRTLARIMWHAALGLALSACKGATGPPPTEPTAQPAPPERPLAEPRPGLESFRIGSTTVYRLKAGAAFDPRRLPAGAYLEDTGVPSERSVTGLEIKHFPDTEPNAPPIAEGIPTVWDRVYIFEGQLYRYRACDGGRRLASMQLSARAFTWYPGHEPFTVPVAGFDKTATGFVVRLDLPDAAPDFMSDRVTVTAREGGQTVWAEWDGQRLLLAGAERRSALPLIVNHCPHDKVDEVDWPAAH